MTRHGKNCTAGTVYTYNERKKDTAQSGYGTDALRLGKDSVKEFDCCCLSLQPCRNPVITPDGFLFDKEAILEYIIHQKRDITKKLKEYEKQKVKEQKDKLEQGKKDQASQVKKFMAKQSISATSASAGSGAGSDNSVSNMADGKKKDLPSFWIPSLTPGASATKLEKPSEKVLCPMSGKVLKLNHLIDIHFTPIKDDGKKSLITKDARYVCAVTNDVLGNSVPCAVLKTSGNVVTMECVEKLVKPEMMDPTNNKPITEKDIIQLQRGATGFSGAGVTLKAKKKRPTLSLS